MEVSIAERLAEAQKEEKSKKPRKKKASANSKPAVRRVSKPKAVINSRQEVKIPEKVETGLKEDIFGTLKARSVMQTKEYQEDFASATSFAAQLLGVSEEFARQHATYFAKQNIWKFWDICCSGKCVLLDSKGNALGPSTGNTDRVMLASWDRGLRTYVNYERKTIVLNN